MHARKIKNIVKSLVAKFYGLLRLKRMRRISIPILCYHSVQESGNYEGDALKPKEFENHLKYFAGNHSVISLKDAVASIKNGKINAPNPVVITFDDGYEDNYNFVFPLLKKYKSHATIFVVTSFIEGNIKLINDPCFGALSWNQIQEMDHSEFVDIGAHTDTHRILSQIGEQDIEQEIGLSKQKLESKLGRPVDLFAYPNGQKTDISEIAKATVKMVGFDSACATSWRSTHVAREIFTLNRIMISGDDTLGTLKAKVRGDFDYIYWVQEFRYLVSRIFN
ncbi:polysaccharide deacetylase family protein [bacterium]|nr:polysaccharide deacetylase family protein [bacterium]